MYYFSAIITETITNMAWRFGQNNALNVDVKREEWDAHFSNDLFKIYEVKVLAALNTAPNWRVKIK